MTSLSSSSDSGAGAGTPFDFLPTIRVAGAAKALGSVGARAATRRRLLRGWSESSLSSSSESSAEALSSSFESEMTARLLLTALPELTARVGVGRFAPLARREGRTASPNSGVFWIRLAAFASSSPCSFRASRASGELSENSSSSLSSTTSRLRLLDME